MTPRIPSTLYHYTSAEGVIGMLGGEGWATMISHLNDSREFTYAIDVARSVFIEETGSVRAYRSNRLLADYLKTIRRIRICVFCLSEMGDLLSQWRAYCPTEGGYSVGFHTGELRQMARQQNAKLVKCVYEREEQKAMLRPVVRKLLRAAEDLPEESAGLDLHRALPRGFAAVAAAIKHPSFNEEQEWRIVLIPPRDGMKHRATNGLIIPYFPLKLIPARKGAIRTVMVGPHRHPAIAARSLKSLAIEKLGWPLKPKRSATPFRAL